MTFSCHVCGQDSGTSLVCPTCLPRLNPGQREKFKRAWHRLIVERAGCACEQCGHSAPFDFGELCGDHIETQGARPDLIFDVTNGSCRCLPCHNKRHNGIHSPKASPKQNREREKKRKVSKNLCKSCNQILAVFNGKCIQCT